MRWFTIHPNIFNGLKNSKTSPAIIANCATHQHDPNETSRLDPFDKSIPYSWGEDN